jgi:hypothetical protein
MLLCPVLVAQDKRAEYRDKEIVHLKPDTCPHTKLIFYFTLFSYFILNMWSIDIFAVPERVGFKQNNLAAFGKW